MVCLSLDLSADVATRRIHFVACTYVDLISDIFSFVFQLSFGHGDRVSPHDWRLYRKFGNLHVCQTIFRFRSPFGAHFGLN